uniref:Uncharacterized protein n=1 Tax=viral metagenome TaxID=1070528 RepID=A0A6C0K1V6_9ZZZZ
MVLYLLGIKFQFYILYFKHICCSFLKIVILFWQYFGKYSPTIQFIPMNN